MPLFVEGASQDGDIAGGLIEATPALITFSFLPSFTNAELASRNYKSGKIFFL
jgi:hypothetical protein